MRPVTDALHNRYGERVILEVVDVTNPENASIWREWNVRGTPTYIFVDSESGEEFGRFEGAGYTLEDFDSVLAEKGITPQKR